MALRSDQKLLAPTDCCVVGIDCLDVMAGLSPAISWASGGRCVDVLAGSLKHPEAVIAAMIIKTREAPRAVPRGSTFEKPIRFFMFIRTFW